MTSGKEECRYDFAISYAGEDFGVAEAIYRGLEYRGYTVYLARKQMAHLWGKNMEEELRLNFSARTRFAIPLVSKNYVTKPFPRLEWDAMCREAERRNGDFILPVRLDDSILRGLHESICYLDLQFCSVDKITALAAEKAGSPILPQPIEWVICFGMNLFEAQEEFASEPEFTTDWPHPAAFYDYLIGQMQQALGRDFLLLEDDRSGETISIRFQASREVIRSFEGQWPPRWEVLELAPYEAIYGGGLENCCPLKGPGG